MESLRPAWLTQTARVTQEAQGDSLKKDKSHQKKKLAAKSEESDPWNPHERRNEPSGLVTTDLHCGTCTHIQINQGKKMGGGKQIILSRRRSKEQL